MILVAGCLVEFSARGTEPGFAAVLGCAGGNVRLLLPNGKETTVTEKKILHATNRAVISVSDREACRNAIHEIDLRRQKRSEEFDLSEIHELLAEETRSFTLHELAGFVAEPDDEDAVAAMLRALTADRLYFKEKNGNYTPMNADEMRLIKQQIEKKQALENEEAQMAADLSALQSGQPLSEQLSARLTELKLFIAAGEEAQINKRLMAALERAGLANPRKLHAALSASGVIGVDENLLLVKYHVPVEFSRELQNLAENLATKESDFSLRLPQRNDLRHLKTWAIDTPGSKDRDDAFSWELSSEGGYRLFVHVADPAEFIEPGSPLDIEAARRGSSIYMPDSRIHMLPPGISEHFLSLAEGADRYALTFILSFSPEIVLQKLEICESVIRIECATEYDKADLLVDSDAWLATALSLAEKLKSRRAEGGAVMFPRQPELEVKVIDGEIQVSHRNRDDLTAGMIAEFMIWANHAAAEWCRSNSVPCLYRIQEMGEIEAKFSETFDPLTFYSALKSFRKTSVSVHAGRHASLGLDSYTQVTSPLRRYADLLLHRQIKAAIKKQPLPYSQSELNQAMMIADEAIVRADEIMRDRERYFLYKYLKQRQKSETLVFDGVVVDFSNNDVTFYCEFLCSFRHCRLPGFDLKVGMPVKVKINQIDLFDGIIRFDLLKP
ncbi:MAG: ribonuclease catalytic domain-containing protein [Candidatus Rifleibacteriota bacterium]